MKRKFYVVGISVLTFGLMFGMNSCSNNTVDETVEEVEELVMDEEPEEESSLNDAQIASIAVTANQIDIEYAEIALEKGSNDGVKGFANSMIKDHQHVIDLAVELAGKLGVTPEDNETTQALLDGAVDVKANFAELTGVDFDKAYIDNEVEYHKFCIDAVENLLVPNTENEELKALLESALPIFKEHLHHAEMVQASVNE